MKKKCELDGSWKKAADAINKCKKRDALSVLFKKNCSSTTKLVQLELDSYQEEPAILCHFRGVQGVDSSNPCWIATFPGTKSLWFPWYCYYIVITNIITIIMCIYIYMWIYIYI